MSSVTPNNQPQPYDIVTASFVRDLVAENNALRAWKNEALAVEREWDVQEVGRLLGLSIGTSIRAGIAPGILRLQAKIAELEEDKSRLLDQIDDMMDR